MPNYERDIKAIRDGEGSDVDKMKRENELSDQLMSLVDQRLDDLKNERAEANSPEEMALIDQDILKVENIKRSTLNAIRINDDQIAQLGGNLEARPQISIGELMPDYEAKIANIDNSELSEIDKLTRKNDLTEQLFAAISSKIETVQEEWEEDPTLGYIYEEELDKLEELQIKIHE